MSIHDMVIANQNGANTRSDLNNALAAIVSNNSSATEPTTTYAYQWWCDTANDLLKQRNAADSAWISILTLSTGAVSNAAIADDAVTLAKMAAGTDGELITYDTSGDPTTVPTGSSGEVLTSNGAGTTPTFQAAAGGGKVLQVVQNTSTTSSTIVGGAGWTDVSGSTLTITPSSTSSKILITFNTGAYTNDASVQECGLRINSSEDGNVSQMTRYFYDKTTLHSAAPVFYTYLDSPASTSAITYKLQALSSTSYWFINQVGGTHSLRIIAMEIGA